MSLANCLIVMLGGAFGTLARYLVSLLAQPISNALPLGTILGRLQAEATPETG